MRIVKETLSSDEAKLRDIKIEGQPSITFDDWTNEVFYFPLEPRKPITEFDQSSGFFISKKIPLRIVGKLSEDRIFFPKPYFLQNYQTVGAHTRRFTHHDPLTLSKTFSESKFGLKMNNFGAAQQSFVSENKAPQKVKIMFKYGDDLR